MAITALELPGGRIGRSAVRLRLPTVGDITFEKLALDVLRFPLRCAAAPAGAVAGRARTLASAPARLLAGNSAAALWSAVVRRLSTAPRVFCFPPPLSVRRDRWMGDRSAPLQRTRARCDHSLPGAERGARKRCRCREFCAVL